MYGKKRAPLSIKKRHDELVHSKYNYKFVKKIKPSEDKENCEKLSANMQSDNSKKNPPVVIVEKLIETEKMAAMDWKAPTVTEGSNEESDENQSNFGNISMVEEMPLEVVLEVSYRILFFKFVKIIHTIMKQLIKTFSYIFRSATIQLEKRPIFHPIKHPM